MLDLASPPPIRRHAALLSGVGDIGGFRHDDLDVSPAGGMSYNPLFGNTTSIDFGEKQSAGRRARGNGLLEPQADRRLLDRRRRQLDRLPHAPAATGTSTPNSGSIAVSADGGTFVWVPKSGTPSYSQRPGHQVDRVCTGLARGVAGRRPIA